jgi:AraC family transcriptional regulator
MNTDTKLSPRIGGAPSMLMAGIVRGYAMSDIRGIPEQWQEFNRRSREIENTVGDAAYGICTNEEGKEGRFLYYTAFEVTEQSALPAGFTLLSIPAHTYAVFTHDGDVNGVPPFVDRIFSEWLPISGFRHSAFPSMIECYDERFDPETGSGITEIWVPIES